jgi:hypothetical protein
VLGRGEEAEDGAVGEHFLDFGLGIADCGLRVGFDRIDRISGLTGWG